MKLRRLLFNIVTVSSATVLNVHEVITGGFIAIQMFVNNGFRLLIAGASLKLMWALDPETMKDYERSQQEQAEMMAQSLGLLQPQPKTETARMNIELKLLEAAYKVRNHAQESDWSDEHTQALEAVGDALLNECGWEEGACTKSFAKLSKVSRIAVRRRLTCYT